jgi:hypothetical protein
MALVVIMAVAVGIATSVVLLQGEEPTVATDPGRFALYLEDKQALNGQDPQAQADTVSSGQAYLDWLNAKAWEANEANTVPSGQAYLDWLNASAGEANRAAMVAEAESGDFAWQLEHKRLLNADG